MLNGDRRFVLALGHDADRLEVLEEVSVLARVRNAVLVEADRRRAAAIAESGEYIHVYREREDALRALAVFE
jgi:hypothetical protein